MVDLFSALG
jgi:hypothetical protein